MKNYIFNTTIYWTHLYEPFKPPLPDAIEHFGLAFDTVDAPRDLCLHLNPKAPSEMLLGIRPDMSGMHWHYISQPFRPTIDVSYPVDLVELHKTAQVCNIRPDHLFDGVPARLAVDLMEGPDGTFRLSKKIIRLLAISVDLADLEKNFETIKTRYFT